jgi:HAE1 family hydrophobic/amphiphilic exporter-1
MTEPVREALAVVPGIEVTIGAAGGLGGVSSPVEVTLAGDSFVTLEGLADDLAERLRGIEGDRGRDDEPSGRGADAGGAAGPGRGG